MKLLHDVFRLRAARSLFAVRRDARVREFVVTVPAPLDAAGMAREPRTVAIAAGLMPTRALAR